MAAPRPSTEWDRLIRFAARMEPDMRRAMIAAFSRLRDLTTERALVEALERGDYDRAVDLMFGDGKATEAYATFRERAREAFEKSGAYAAGGIPPLRLVGVARAAEVVRVRFDVLHPAVLDAVRDFDARLMRTVEESAREGMREVIRLGLEQGQNPRAVARDMRQLVGLGPRQSQAVVNFRRYLETGDRVVFDRLLRDKRFDATIRKVWEKGGSLTQAQVDKYVTAYERRYKAWQAETAARTTSIGALKEGQLRVWEQAIADGRVERSEVFKTWHTAHDERVRETHAAMDRARVHFDEPWILPDGKVQMVPGENEWNCRCVSTYRVRLPVKGGV